MFVAMHQQQQIKDRQTCHVLMFVIIGCLMICASVLPWLKDPLDETFSAWNVAVDLGWQFSSDIFNYGLLCLCAAAFAFLVAYMQWKARGDDCFNPPRFACSVVPSAAFCLLPPLLFFWQYLFVDMRGVNLLTQHDIQALLIKLHLGYSVPGQVLSMSPFAVSNATVLGRLEIIINHLSLGFFVAGIAAVATFVYMPFFATSTKVRVAGSLFSFGRVMLFVGFLLLMVALGRAPAASLCEYQAKQALALGDYTSARQWLDAAHRMNPQLEQMPYYHREIGEVWTSLYPGSQSPDSHVYLAFVARSQQDYLGAYHELLSIWQTPQQKVPSWVLDEMRLTLEQLAEIPQLSNTPSTQQIMDVNQMALPWLQILSQLDASNVYSAYVVGRIYYVQQSYDDCQIQMRNVIHLSRNMYILSSAYTYMALSMEKQGDSKEAREMLFEAVKLDPYYHNNTAREELSGLH